MEKLRKIREDKNLSQKQIANLLSLPISTYANWEQGRREPSTFDLVKLADFFECTIDYLVGREDDFGIVAVKSDLSEEEKELVSCFSKMDDIQKRAILMTARSFAKNKTEDLLSTK